MTMTIDGVEVPFTSFNYQRREPDYGFDLRSVLAPASFSFETTIPMKDGLEGFASLFRREPVGASYATLARRVRYGGRKGRSAMRRLFARALPIELSTADGDRFVGRAVMLDETQMILRARSRR